MSKIDTQGLTTVMQEYDQLSRKVNQTKHEQRRMAYLQSAAATLRKGGVTLQDLDLEEHEHLAKAAGVEIENGHLTHKQRHKLEKRMAKANGWRALVMTEQRDMAEAVPLTTHIGTYSGLGFFVPNGWTDKLYRAMAAADALMDEDVATVLKTEHGRPIPVPVIGDTEVVADLVGEGNPRFSTNLSKISQSNLGAWSFATPLMVVSTEAFDDMDGALSMVDVFKVFAADRLSRGIGRYMINGTGVNQPNGLLTALTAAGVVPVPAQGVSGNTGGSQTGANSLGSIDFANALLQLDSAYINERAYWLMNQNTLATLSTYTDKMGRVLNIVDYSSGKARILGIPVAVCPSLPNIGASNTPVVLGDCSYWCTRLCLAGDNIGVKVYRERYAEKGQVALQSFVRADGALLWNDVTSKAPFVPIQNHS